MNSAIYDGIVSRHLNRRVSRPLARLIAHTPVTPNQVSVASLGLAIACFASFAYGYYIIGALLAQASSIADGIDGDLARLKNMTSAFGGFMDAIFDRYADSLVLLGFTMWAASDAGTYVWVVGFSALAGTFTVTYTRAKIDDEADSRLARTLQRGGLQHCADAHIDLAERVEIGRVCRGVARQVYLMHGSGLS